MAQTGRDQQPVNPVSGRRETEDERLDRNFNELLQELRVAQTGTQILFAFLLTVAFTPVMQDADDFSQRLLAGTLVMAALATAVLIAPVAVHRTVFRRGMKQQLVDVTSGLASFGLALVVLAMVGGTLLALDALVPRPVAAAVTAGVGLWFAAMWLALPWRLRRRGDRRSAR